MSILKTILQKVTPPTLADLDQIPDASQPQSSACRLFCLLSFGSFLIFSVIDPIVYSGPLVELLIYRLVVVAGTFFTFGLTFTQFGRNHATTLSMAIVVWIGLGLVLVTELTGGAGSYYWTVIMLTYSTAALVFPFTTWQAFNCFLIITISYFGWLTLHDATGSTADWVVSNTCIVLSQFVSTLAVWYLSQNQQRRIDKNQELQRLNTQLRAEIAERERAEDEVVRTQQLDAVGRLAAGLAHEINNVLMVITGTAECILMNPANEPADLRRIVESAQRGGRLTSGLLQFARQGTRENASFDMRNLFEQVNDIVKRSHRGRVKLEVTQALDPCWVLGDSQLLSQAILNLALNGIDAMDGSGTLHMSLQRRNQMVEVEVRDNGCGMTSEELSQAMEPFFTTKPPGAGTGLGLSMAYGTVQDHGGELKLESEHGVGTRAIMSIPISEPENPTFSDQPSANSAAKYDGACAILVDDDDMVRDTMRGNLENLGMKVTAYSSGMDAIEKFKSEHSQIDLVGIDMVMPEMDGREIFRRIREFDSKQAILIYSGFAQNQSITQMLELGRCRFLRKPFRNQELHSAIAQIVPADTSV